MSTTVPTIGTLTARLNVLQRVVEVLQQQPDPAARTRGTVAVRAALDCTRGELTDLARQAAPANVPLKLTDAQTTLVYDEFGGWRTTTPISTPSRSLDPGDPDDLPFLEARVVTLDWGYDDQHRQVDGHFTEVWLDTGYSTAPLTPARARQVVGELLDFAVRLELLCDYAEKVAAEDHQDDEDAAVRRSVDAQFPIVAAFLADEQKGGR